MKFQETLSQQFVIPVVREKDRERLLGVCGALRAGGCRVFEITLMSAAALDVISELSRDSSLWVGAGTVLNRGQGAEAVKRGAKFLVSPGTCEELLVDSPVPYLPGVATPTEVMKAVAHGARFLKLFPAQALGGVSLLKNLMAPFPQVSWMPTGGIDSDTISAYRKAGAICVGVGGKLFPAAEVTEKNWSAISKRFQEWAAIR